MNQTTDPIIYIIDDDPSVGRSLGLLLQSAGHRSVAFGQAEEFFGSAGRDHPGCILLDVFLKGDSGLELQEEILKGFPLLPVIYMTGRGDIPMSVKALRNGALNFLEKPIDERTFFTAVTEALAVSQKRLKEAVADQTIRQQYDTLTPREKQVLSLLAEGLLNKQMADSLNIREHTVKIHRGNLTRKLGLKSVAELVRFLEKVESGR